MATHPRVRVELDQIQDRHKDIHPLRRQILLVVLKGVDVGYSGGVLVSVLGHSEVDIGCLGEFVELCC